MSEIQLDINSSASKHVGNGVDKGCADVCAIWDITIHGFKLSSNLYKLSAVQLVVHAKAIGVDWAGKFMLSFQFFKSLDSSLSWLVVRLSICKEHNLRVSKNICSSLNYFNTFLDGSVDVSSSSCCQAVDHVHSSILVFWSHVRKWKDKILIMIKLDDGKSIFWSHGLDNCLGCVFQEVKQ